MTKSIEPYLPKQTDPQDLKFADITETTTVITINDVDFRVLGFWYIVCDKDGTVHTTNGKPTCRPNLGRWIPGNHKFVFIKLGTIEPFEDWQKLYRSEPKQDCKTNCTQDEIRHLRLCDPKLEELIEVSCSTHNAPKVFKKLGEIYNVEFGPITSKGNWTHFARITHIEE